MANAAPSDTIIQFRLKRAEQFARQWRSNAKRLSSLASDPRIPKLVRTDALAEAQAAAGIVGKRVGELRELAKQRGYTAWEADPTVGPLMVEIQSVENALLYAAEALSH